jgi:hypothetical protein
MNTLKIENKAITIKFKDDSDKTVEHVHNVTAECSFPTSNPLELSEWVKALDPTSEQFKLVASSLESVGKSRTVYAVACHHLKPSLEVSDIPKIITLDWAFTPLSTGRFGYRKASTDAETKADLLKAKLTQLEELVAEGMIDAKAGKVKMDILKVEIKEQLKIATDNSAKADKQAEDAKATKEANKNKTVKDADPTDD